MWVYAKLLRINLPPWHVAEPSLPKRCLLPHRLLATNPILFQSNVRTLDRKRTRSMQRGNEESAYSFFFGCYAATQPTLLLYQERTQMVCGSNKEAWKRKHRAESNGTAAMDLGHMIVVLKWCICMLVMDSGIVIVVFRLVFFFLSRVSKTQPNHWTKRMASTRLAT